MQRMPNSRLPAKVLAYHPKMHINNPMKKLMLLVAAVCCSGTLWLHAQDPKNAQEKFDFKFGKVVKEDFTLPADAIEKDAAAYTICDKGFTEFEGNSKGWFTLKFTRKVRIKINNINGIDAADFRIPLYHNGSSVERLMGLKAIAFNLEGDKVVETALKSDQVFVDKYSKRLDFKKFSVPGAKAGSLIDVTYTIESDFLNALQPWAFQNSYPCYWSEYEVGFPFFFNYVTLMQGYQPFYQRSSNEVRQNFNIMIPSDEGIGGRSQMVTEEANVQFTRWVMKNVPALKEEAFTSSLENHISKIEFQLKQLRFEGSPYREMMGSWPAVVQRYNEFESFGLNLYKNNGFLDDEIKPVVAKANTPMEKAQALYAYVRDKYTCTGGGDFLTSNLRAVPKTKSGNVGDLNLLLTAMLNRENIEAHPVILSTRSNGWAHELYPLTDRYNYVVVRARIDGKEYMLDATDPGLPFGVLPPQCYNGQAREIWGLGAAIELTPDSITEKKTSTFFLSTGEDGKWTGEFTSNFGVYESLAIRQESKKNGLQNRKNQIKKAAPSEFVFEEPAFEQLENPEQQVKVRYAVKPQVEEDADLIYLNPMLAEGFKENPFKSAERLYPVEMPYTMNEIYVANIEVPAGYVLEEAPKSTKVNLFDDEGFFEYMVSTDGTRVMLRIRLVIKRAEFAAEDYEGLREFFSYVVKKQAETIVFKKKPKQ